MVEQTKKIYAIIETFATKENLLFGCAKPRVYTELLSDLLEKEKQLATFVSAKPHERIDPFASMETVATILVFAMGYGKETSKENLQGLRGGFSMGAVGEDYHTLFRQKLGRLQQLLEKEGIATQAFSDTGPLPDGVLAVEAGLGYSGKNAMVHTQWGSMVFFGYVLMDFPLAPTPKATGSCGSCTGCIKSCPTGALQEGGFITERCVSAITQKKGLLSPKEMTAIGRQLYGCDCCQLACPHNLKEYFEPLLEGEKAFPLLEDILSLSKKEFQETIGKTAAGWRGDKIIKRNALAVLGNSKSKEALPILGRFLKSESNLLQHTAIQAIGNLGFFEGIAILEQALPLVSDVVVGETLEDTIGFLRKKGK